MRERIIDWQWQGYPSFHQTPLTLWVHLFAVPAFIFFSLGLVHAAVTLRPLGIAVALAGMALAFGVQGFTHKREPTPPIPFDGPGDAIARILLEQFFTFPRFVLSGGFLRALQAKKHS